MPAKTAFGMPPLLIGMVIVGFGTSTPEMVGSAPAAIQGTPGLAPGNIIGSNLFNTLAVVGIAGVIQPATAGPEVFNRDMLVIGALTVSLFVIGYGFRGPGRVNRFEGTALLVCYVAYTVSLTATLLTR
jgi:cation:H+ antiporter